MDSNPDENPEQPAKKPRRKNRIRVRNKTTHVKRHVSKTSPVTEKEAVELGRSYDVSGNSCDLPETSSDETGISSDPLLSSLDFTEDKLLDTMEFETVLSPILSVSQFSRPTSRLSAALSVSLPDLSEDTSMSETSDLSPTPTPVSCGRSGCTPCQETVNELQSMPQTSPLPNNSEELKQLLLNVREKLILMLPAWCVVMVDNAAIHVLMVGVRESKAVQRQITVSTNGAVRIQVHGADYPAHKILSGVQPQKPLSELNCGYFVDRFVKIVSNVRILEICAGMNKSDYKEAWPHCSQGVIEGDLFKETRYFETLRSKQCSLLIPSKDLRCKECTKLQPILRRKMNSLQKENTSKFTNTRYLAGKQKDARLAEKQKKIKMQQQTIDRLEARMTKLIEDHGIKVEKNLSDDMKHILESADLSQTHSLFLQQQIKAITCKKSSGMRWHPTLIRMALSIYLKAPGAYKELCESGFVKLPTSRTLFDYSHATKVQPGIDKTVVETVVKQASSDTSTHNQYFVLMADEMHISKNLVMLKSTGELIGFKDLDDIDQEVTSLQSYLDDPDKPVEPEIASKVMAFMVKAVSSKLKHVVASYPVCNPTPTQMYMWTWDVIGALERSGVKIIAFICDGASSNRAFIRMHKPFTTLLSGVVFDTVNKFAPDRLLYFFSDVPHLLKTARNACFNSRRNAKNRKKSPRLLKKNNELIVWDTIIRLYLSKKEKTLSKSYKLNAQNVYPDSYSRMKVRPAAEVLSLTVATDILSWPQTSETVDFIKNFNNWFDLLNGAHSSQGRKKNNYRLDPYTIKDVEDFENGSNGRFQELLDFLKYLDEWKEEVQARKNNTLSTSQMSLMDDLGVQPLEEGSFQVLNDSQIEVEEDGNFSKNLLPHQTLLGIEMSTRVFIAACTFLVKAGVSFINARVFCQDPLEQNFGRQRMAGGGSTNPNLNQFLHKQRGFSTIGELSAANKRGNTEVVGEDIEIDTERLPKRKAVKRTSVSSVAI